MRYFPIPHLLFSFTIMPTAYTMKQKMETNYFNVKVKLDIKRFKTVVSVFKGELIRHGLTIPNNTPHPESAKRFIEFLYSHEGQQVLRDAFHPLILPLTAGHPAPLSSSLKAFVGP